VLVGGANHSHATKDLVDAIAAGNYPTWILYIQTMDPADEDKYDFDPLDDTKIWPEDVFPLQVSIFTVLKIESNEWQV
jgi:catalase